MDFLMFTDPHLYKEILSLSTLILNALKLGNKALKLGNKALNLSNIIFSTPLLGHIKKSPF